MVWPSNRISGASTINGAKGMNYFIADRLDLTIECIRRYYLGETSPLYETLKRYDDFSSSSMTLRAISTSFCYKIM